jgi:hypothetical protein
MHDCEQDFNLIIEYFFDEATFFVNFEIRKRDFRFPGVENMQFGTCLAVHSYT